MGQCLAPDITRIRVAGKNPFGQCGIQPAVPPYQIVADKGSKVVWNLSDPAGYRLPRGAIPTSVSFGVGTVFCIAQGRLYHAGDNGAGQMGRGVRDHDPHIELTQVPLPTTPVQVSCCFHSIFCLLIDKTVVTWGNVSRDTSNKPQRIHGLRNVEKIYTGYEFAFFVLTNGDVMAMGENSGGQLCLGRATEMEQKPLRVPVLCNKVASMAFGAEHGLALLKSGAAVAWGRLRYLPSFSCMLADGSEIWRPERGCVPLPIDVGRVAAIGSGAGHLGILLEDGTLRLWGDGHIGQQARVVKQFAQEDHRPRKLVLPGGKMCSMMVLSYCATFLRSMDGEWYGSGDIECLPFGRPAERKGAEYSLCKLPIPKGCELVTGSMAGITFYIEGPAAYAVACKLRSSRGRRPGLELVAFLLKATARLGMNFPLLVDSIGTVAAFCTGTDFELVTRDAARTLISGVAKPSREVLASLALVAAVAAIAGADHRPKVRFWCFPMSR